MVNYQLGKIYQILDNTNGNIYIGSTCQNTLAQRLAKHVSNYNDYLKNKNSFMTSFNIIKNKNYEIILLENSPCNSKDELHARERYYIQSMNCVNKVVPLRTCKEYKIDNKEQIKARDSEKIPCIHCGICYTRQHKARHERTKAHINNVNDETSTNNNNNQPNV